MPDSYRVVYRGGEGEIIEKKSRFIATVRPVETEEEAAAFIQEMKKQYWDARHNCSAFVIGERAELTRCSDDGEPSGTAGRPMLEVLLGEGLCNVAVVVTRYFGGTLLGTGGLVRAYGQAVKAGLSQCTVISKEKGELLSIITDYNDIGRLQHLLAGQQVPVMDTVYGEKVTIRVVLPLSSAEAVKQAVTEATGARALLETGGQTVFAVIEGQVKVFT